MWTSSSCNSNHLLYCAIQAYNELYFHRFKFVFRFNVFNSLCCRYDLIHEMGFIISISHVFSSLIYLFNTFPIYTTTTDIVCRLNMKVYNIVKPVLEKCFRNLGFLNTPEYL